MMTRLNSPVGDTAPRAALSDAIDQIKRAWAMMAERRARPLQDIDRWSDQAEVAYYEDCRTSRCL